MALSKIDVVPATDIARWYTILSRIRQYDTYHLPEYHRVAKENDTETGILMVYEEGDQLAAWPFLKRNLQYIPGLETAGAGWYDATSVYGYPGPIASLSARSDKGFLQRFNGAVLKTARELKIVSLFSRLNPILHNVDLLTNVGEAVYLGETVTIDLSLDLRQQWRQYRKSHRFDIRNARQLGIRVLHDTTWSALDEFFRLYLLTMQLNGADSKYYFSREYFLSLRAQLGDRIHLFVAIMDSKICSAALFLEVDGIIQYHLSGNDPSFARYAPSKLIIDEARLWGNSIGARCLHLGGGVGAKHDSLFLFKSGFSPIRNQFYIWRCISEPQIYQQLTEHITAARLKSTAEPRHPDYFPGYRNV